MNFTLLNNFKFSLILFATICLSNTAFAQVSFISGELKLVLNKSGAISELSNSPKGKNFLYTDTISPLITLVSKNIRYKPSSMIYDKSLKKITLSFKEVGVSIDIIAVEKSTHLTLEIAKATPANKVEAVIWGPIPTTISRTIGEIIGVVRDGETSLGIQVLNIKTLGGDYPNKEGSTWARGIAAVPAKWGSKLQAYSINRDLNRSVDAWVGLYKNMPLGALKGESVVGSKIAIFSCQETQTFDRLEQIELAENLPHPTIDGVWFKKSKLYGKSYMISSYGEKDIDEMIGYTKRAGLVSLYHEGPFKSWGNFILNPEQFPNGKNGLKECVDKAHAAGLYLGMHTLTNFINTNDPYVSPVPDKRLSVTGTSNLIKKIDSNQLTIEVASPEYFKDEAGNNLHTVKIGNELIRYKTVSKTAPYILSDCQRGAFGTEKSEHLAGEQVGKLFDHPYNVFFPNLEMQREIAKNIADLMNETGVDHLDLDGHEGALASGQGDYALELFAKDVYDQVKHDFIIGTSLSKTFYWHIGSYYNWGEPWYGGFKESMQQYRIDNQGLFDRNYMPHMLGWYLLAENTTLPEMEWMLARAAGYNAGFAMVARPNALRKNSQTNQLLDAIREWEFARNNNAFNKAQQEQLKNPKNEFHLEKIEDGKWILHQYAMSEVFKREKFERQPGEPTHTTWNLMYNWKEQPLQFRMQIAGDKGSVKNIKMQIDNYKELLFPIELAAGESLVSDGTETIRFYDKNGKPKGSFKLASIPPNMTKGPHSIIIDSEYPQEDSPKIEVQFKGIDKSENIQILKK
ncbi:hypothetical protein [Daejeonella sp.]|uniref:hypothetical protein n=1 Tax=Daejeonella sp. TaxID=2805397 RepID=UPI0025C5BC14|nr:hypothetical protein [Daejeonella sp.]